MKVFAKFDEIPSMTLQDIKETKHYGHTFVRADRRTDVRADRRTDNVKTVYPPTNTVCGGGGGGGGGGGVNMFTSFSPLSHLD